MAFIQESNTKFHWNGFSSDLKPTSGTPEGSTFHVVDTGEEYIFHNKMWVRDLRMINALNGTNN